jgi:ATP-binding cassette subfamily B protein
VDDDLKFRQTSTDLKLLKPALGFLKPYKLQLAVAAFALLFTSGLSLSFGQGLKVIIDHGYLTTSPESLSKSVIAFIILMLLIAVGTYLRFNIILWIGERVSADIRKSVFKHVIDLHPSFFDHNLSGEIQTRITTDTAIIQSVISVSASIALRNGIMFLGGILLMTVSNIKLSLIVFALIISVVFPLKFFGQRVRQLSRNSQDRIANAGAYVGETLSNIKTVHAFNHQHVDKTAFDKHIEFTFDAGVQHVRMRALMIAAILSLVGLAMGCMLWVGGNDVMSGRISAGELAAFSFYAAAVGVAVAAISEVVGDLMRAAGAMERLMELLSSENLLDLNSPEKEKVNQQALGEIEIKDLSFAYPSRPEKLALRNLNLNVSPGETLALVGHSGAGKSTLFDLLMRFYDPQEGSINIDQQNIKTIELDDLRAKLAIVPQNPTIFTGDVISNIRYGKPEASLEEVKVAADAAYASEFIDLLPKAYETFIGESGAQLSGGQRQRLAIARAILRDPEILLLDEATSALDAKSEHIVQLALDKLMENRTSIVIAHRLATVMNADRIAVIDEGEIIAVGKHHELLETCPLYERLAELQFGH